MRFSDVRGQERAIKILKQAIYSNHVAQTYLFHGPDGVGKKMVAVGFAMALNCSDYRDDACGMCKSCRKIEQGIHPDVTILQSDNGEIKIGAIRDVINGMVYRPLEGKNRVLIVDEAERFNTSASNAFLKTLEEPPAETVIILVSSSPDLLPQTVLSRCHKVSFSQIPVPVITEILVHKNGIEKGAAEYIACLAEGSIGRAIALSSKDVQKVRRKILEGFFSFGDKDRSVMFDLSEDIAKDEGTFNDALYWTCTYLRDLLILKEKGTQELLINKDLRDELLKIKDSMTVERLLDVMGFVQSIYKGQERNMNRQLALDVLGNRIIDSRVGIAHLTR